MGSEMTPNPASATGRERLEPRPPVDVVVPFAGAASDLEATVRRLSALRLGARDTLVIVDNRPPGAVPVTLGEGRARVLRAPELQSPAFARNRGAAAGSGEWLVFIDADVEAPADLLEHYLESPPHPRTAVLAGAVLPPVSSAQRESTATRFAALRGHMSQQLTLERGRWSFAQTANCAVRRRAFASVDGFREHLRTGEDADLCFRLAALGWRLEARPGAAAHHHHRSTLPALLRQCALHGAGAAWLDHAYPGSFPPRRRIGLCWWTLRRLASAGVGLLRGDADAALLGALDPPTVWAFELGRVLPNRAASHSGSRAYRR